MDNFGKPANHTQHTPYAHEDCVLCWWEAFCRENPNEETQDKYQFGRFLIDTSDYT